MRRLEVRHNARQLREVSRPAVGELLELGDERRPQAGINMSTGNVREHRNLFASRYGLDREPQTAELFNTTNAPFDCRSRNRNEGFRTGYPQGRNIGKRVNGCIDTSRIRRTLRLEKDTSGRNEPGTVDEQAAEATENELIEDTSTRGIDVPERLIVGNDACCNNTAAN
jgi:hypothetical protein